MGSRDEALTVPPGSLFSPPHPLPISFMSSGSITSAFSFPIWYLSLFSLSLFFFPGTISPETVLSVLQTRVTGQTRLGRAQRENQGREPSSGGGPPEAFPASSQRSNLERDHLPPPRPGPGRGALTLQNRGSTSPFLAGHGPRSTVACVMRTPGAPALSCQLRSEVRGQLPGATGLGTNRFSIGQNDCPKQLGST